MEFKKFKIEFSSKNKRFAVVAASCVFGCRETSRLKPNFHKIAFSKPASNLQQLPTVSAMDGTSHAVCNTLCVHRRLQIIN